MSRNLKKGQLRLAEHRRIPWQEKVEKTAVSPESTAQIGQMSYVTAIYARLSVENSGKQDEGASLQNQIDVCKEYVAGCPYLRLAEVYVDNGKNRHGF